jgi:hypothetical protein
MSGPIVNGDIVVVRLMRVTANVIEVAVAGISVLGMTESHDSR